MKFRSSVPVAFAGALALFAACLFSACSSSPKKHAPAATGGEVVAPPAQTQAANAGGKDCSRYQPAQEDPSTRGDYTRGGLYKPGVRDTTPDFVPDLDCIREPVVDDEPHSAIGNNSPYYVLGKKYKVLDSASGYVERGTASYYGNKFHGRLTSNHEVYDMYAFTAAHKTLPLPSFARVTNLDNGRSVIVRINDRGPFHDGRLIDLSYAAAVKLGVVGKGTGNVEVRGLTPRDMRRAGAAQRVDDSVHAPPSGDDAGHGVQAVAVTLDDAPVAAAPLPAASPLPPVAAATADAPKQPMPTLSAPAKGLQLQVASFANRDNAERALGKLRAAGIEGELLASEDGSRWRLRVPTSETEADRLAQRIVQLGFERPQRVRD